MVYEPKAERGNVGDDRKSDEHDNEKRNGGPVERNDGLVEPEA